MSDIKLKPCPFCGKPPGASIEYENYIIRCQNQDCLVTALVCEEVEDKQEAITAWNRRAGRIQGGIGK